MKLQISCPNCSKAFKVPTSASGKIARCSSCNHRFRIAPTEESANGQSSLFDSIDDLGEMDFSGGPELPRIPSPSMIAPTEPVASLEKRGGVTLQRLLIGLMTVAAMVVIVATLIWILPDRDAPQSLDADSVAGEAAGGRDADSTAEWWANYDVLRARLASMNTQGQVTLSEIPERGICWKVRFNGCDDLGNISLDLPPLDPPFTLQAPTCRVLDIPRWQALKKGTSVQLEASYRIVTKVLSDGGGGIRKEFTFVLVSPDFTSPRVKPDQDKVAQTLAVQAALNASDGNRRERVDPNWLKGMLSPQTSSLPQIIAAFATDSEEIRIGAARLLAEAAKTDHRHVASLAAGLSGSSQYVTRAVCSELDAVIPQASDEALSEVIPSLELLLKHKSDDMVQIACNSLALCGPRAKSALPSLFEICDPEKRGHNGETQETAARAIGAIDPGWLADQAEKLINNDDRHVVSAGVRLCSYGDERAAYLALKAHNQQKCSLPELLRVLQELGPVAAAPGVPFLIGTIRSNGQDGFTLANAMRVLGAIGPAAADSIPLLVEIMERSQDATLVALAEAALAKIDHDLVKGTDLPTMRRRLDKSLAESQVLLARRFRHRIATLAPDSFPLPQRPEFRMTKHGNGSRHVVLISGLGSDESIWNDCLNLPSGIDPQAHLRERRTQTPKEILAEYEFYTVALAGFAGLPAVEPPLFDRWIEALEESIGDLQLIRPVIGGHGLGGHLALRYAIKHSDEISGVICCDGMPVVALPAQDATTDAIEAAANALERDLRSAAGDNDKWAEYIQAFSETLVPEPVKREHPETVKELANMMLKSDREAMIKAAVEMASTDLRGDLAKITAPVWIICPTKGPFTSKVEAIYRAAFDGKKLVGVNEVLAAHFMMLQPESFQGVLSNGLNWMQSQEYEAR